MVSVKQIDASYAETLSKLGARLFSDTFSSDNKPENMEAYIAESYAPDIQTKELNDPAMTTFMAFNDDNEPVAFCQLRQNKDVYDFVGDADAIELQRIYVDKSCAGTGIGSKLMNACLDKAKEMGKKTMWLGVWEHNPNAIRFYERYGFYKVGSHIFKLGEQEDTDYIFIKKL